MASYKIILTIVTLALCLVDIFSISIELDEIAVGYNGFPRCRLRPRSNASNQESVWIFGGETVTLQVCLPTSSYVNINDFVYSNDGWVDTVTIAIDDEQIGVVESPDESNVGELWNNFHKSGPVGQKYCTQGAHVITITVANADKWGIEFDKLDLSFGNNDWTIDDVRCPNSDNIHFTPSPNELPCAIDENAPIKAMMNTSTNETQSSNPFDGETTGSPCSEDTGLPCDTNEPYDHSNSPYDATQPTDNADQQTDDTTEPIYYTREPSDYTTVPNDFTTDPYYETDLPYNQRDDSTGPRGGRTNNPRGNTHPSNGPCDNNNTPCQTDDYYDTDYTDETTDTPNHTNSPGGTTFSQNDRTSSYEEQPDTTKSTGPNDFKTTTQADIPHDPKSPSNYGPSNSSVDITNPDGEDMAIQRADVSFCSGGLAQFDIVSTIVTQVTLSFNNPRPLVTSPHPSFNLTSKPSQLYSSDEMNVLSFPGYENDMWVSMGGGNAVPCSALQFMAPGQYGNMTSRFIMRSDGGISLFPGNNVGSQAVFYPSTPSVLSGQPKPTVASLSMEQHGDNFDLNMSTEDDDMTVGVKMEPVSTSLTFFSGVSRISTISIPCVNNGLVSNVYVAGDDNVYYSMFGNWRRIVGKQLKLLMTTY